jgi:hypothetical protein
VRQRDRNMRDTLKVTTAGKGGVVRCTLSKETQSVLEILWRSAGRTRSDGLTRFAPQTIPPSDALCEAALPNPTIATNRLGMKFYKHPPPSMSVMGPGCVETFLVVAASRVFGLGCSVETGFPVLHPGAVLSAGFWRSKGVWGGYGRT